MFQVPGKLMDCNKSRKVRLIQSCVIGQLIEWNPWKLRTFQGIPGGGGGDTDGDCGDSEAGSCGVAGVTPKKRRVSYLRLQLGAVILAP